MTHGYFHQRGSSMPILWPYGIITDYCYVSLVLLLQAAAKVQLLNFSQILKFDFKTYGTMQFITLKPLVVPSFCLGVTAWAFRL